MNKYPDKIAGATGTSPEGSVKVTYDMSSYKTSGEIYTDTQSKSTFKLENTGIKGLAIAYNTPQYFLMPKERVTVS